ncbi:MAG TPA: ABC transporter permease [Chthoniobacterales bacterium]|nr:ABC transporter permease [Chthoniobacterales bacterium]
METLIQDLRYGARQLLKRPGFTLLAIISMALGIGANTAIFSLVDTVAFRPLPVRNASELQELYGTLHNGADYTLQSYLNYKDYRDRNQVFSGLIAYRLVVASLSHNGNNERVWGTTVSGNYFDVLGVPLALGRGFLPEEDQIPKSHPVIILSHGCWQKRFGADPGIVGRTVSLNNVVFTVVGVAPKDFIGTELAYSPEFWAPLMMSPVIEPGSTYLDQRVDNNLFVIGRLKPGVTKAQAEAALKIMTEEMGREHPTENAGRGIELIPPGLFIPSIRNAVFAFAIVLTVVGALVLLLACVNLANLLLARATERRKEIAIRLAVGASRGRLIRQLLTESVMLSVAGGAAGVLLATWINHLVRTIKLPTDIALIFDLRVDWRVLSFALVLSLITGLVFSLIPAVQSSKPQLVPALKDESALAGFRRSRLRNTLVIVQVALSLVLLICAGLIVRSLQEAQRMRPGFNPQNAVALSFDLGLQGYDETKNRVFQRQVLERVRALPGIESAALTDNIPLSLNYNNTSIYVEGQPPTPMSKLPLAIPTSVTPDYFRAMGMSLRGRDFTDQEDKKENRVAIVNETFARKFFPGQEVIGKRFNFGGPENPFWEIIGVCGDGKYNSLGEDPQPAFFRPQLRDCSPGISLVARIRGDPQPALAALQREIHSLDPTLPLYDIKTLTEHMKIPLFPARIAAGALASFGVLALVLAAVGIYGVMSYVVAGRTREIGLRMALGARTGNVRRLILRQGMMLALIGSMIGLGIAFLATRLLKSVLYGVSAIDPTTFVGVTFVLGAVALLACWIPALRASRVDPMVALRAE